MGALVQRSKYWVTLIVLSLLVVSAARAVWSVTRGERVSRPKWVAIAWKDGQMVDRFIRFEKPAEHSRLNFEQAARAYFASRGLKSTERLTFAATQSEASIWHIPLLENFQIVPGRDGLGIGDCLLPPQVLFSEGLYVRGLESPIADLPVGVSLADAERLVHAHCGKGRLRRIRFLTWTASQAQDYPVWRAVTLDAVNQSVRAAAEFLIRHQDAEGQYTYVYDAHADRPLQEGYDLARHAGAALFLAQVAKAYAGLDAQWVRRVRHSASLAWDWLASHGLQVCANGALCVVDPDGLSRLSPTGLALLLAVALYRLEPNATRLDAVKRLASWIKILPRKGEQKNTDFVHVADPQYQAPGTERWMYASGEGVLALLETSEVTADEESLVTAVRVLDWLTSKGWRFFGDRYYFGEEHWTCISAGFLAERLNGLQRFARVTRQALRFCNRWAAYNRAVQYKRGETLWQVEGAYGFGTLIPPRITPVASRTEALIAVYRATRSVILRNQIDKGIGLLLAYQWLPGPTYAMKDPARAEGGMPGSPFELTSRNDFVQHAGSSLLAWREVLSHEP